MKKFILASTSPRRIQMLRDLNISFTSKGSNITEKKRPKETPIKYVRRLALEKSKAIIENSNIKNVVVLSADTIVVHKNKILEKPKTKKHAMKMLEQLSGKTHFVLTSWCWALNQNGKIYFHIKTCKTSVTFSKKNSKFWNWYSNTKEPMDKAGAYAAQGIGMSFIKQVRGSYSNVIGLPICQVLEHYKKITTKDLIEEFK